MDLKHDYVKIPRVVSGVDMVNGREVSSADYARRKAKGDYSLKDYFGYEKVKNEYGQPLIVYKKIKNEIIGHHVYKLINLYGDGDRATENYEYFKPSAIDNGSMKISLEIPNADIINYYGAGLTKEDVSLPAIEAPVVEKEYIEFEEVSNEEPKSAQVTENFYEGNIKPEPNTIFVFGSNPEGIHGAGAAKIAVNQFGAKRGQGEGLQGNAYALPTKDLRVKENNGFKSISPEQITENIKKLYNVARENPTKQFKIAYRNTTDKSLNGYTGLEMIDMFNNASYTQELDENGEVIESTNIPSNVIFSKEWIDTKKLNKPVVKETKQRELFTFERGMAQKSFRGKTLNFVDNIATTKETVVAMSNSKKTGVISIDQKAMAQKFEDKAWTKPAKQSDGSFATPLAETQFSTMDEWFTFALIHEVKHDTILKQEGETTGQYEDRINQAAIADLTKNYNIEESTAEVMTDLGMSISSLGISQEEWNSLSVEEKEQIKKCN